MTFERRDDGELRRTPRLTAKGAATRQRIVDGATGLIADRGVAGTSIEQVREAAGVSSSQLYHYFENKQALVRAVIVQQADALAQDSALQDGALNNFEALRAWAEATLERQAGLHGRQCDLTTLAGELVGVDDAAKRELLDGFSRWRQALRSGLARMQEANELRAAADLDELAAVLMTALQGGSQLATAMGDVGLLRAAMRGALAYVESFATTAAAPAAAWVPSDSPEP
jgi:TetR/AcrR family transcriptional repressor of nem operon